MKTRMVALLGGLVLLASLTPIGSMVTANEPVTVQQNAPFGQIAFVSDRDGDLEIYTMNVDGTALTQLTDNDWNDESPSWSPDGNQILFHSDRDGYHQLYVMNADGTNESRLVTSATWDQWPLWSPSGDKVAFARIADHNGDGLVHPEVFVVNTDGVNAIRLTYSYGESGGYAHEAWPSGWSPDGSKILFYRYQNRDEQCWIMNVDGSNQYPLTSGTYWNAIPTMSPDGMQIAFSSYRDGDYEIYIMNTDGTNQRRLTYIAGEDFKPTWSRDGSKLLFESSRDGRKQIYWMNPDGSQQMRLTDNTASDTQAWWRPGEQLDIGFRSNPDGYSFSNYGGSYPLTSAEYTIDDMRRMFGDDAVCHMISSSCFPKMAALSWSSQVNLYMNGGHCDGMTSTSLRFFKGMDNRTDFQAGASTTHDLQLNNVRRHIAYYWVLQVPNPVAAARNEALQKTPNQVLDQLRSAMSGGATDPTTLLVYNADHTSGHSVTPYAIEDRGEEVYRVRVYDNNDPDDVTRYVEINTANNSWSSNLIGIPGTWSGDVSTHSLGAIPISVYAQQSECPWCNDEETLSGTPSGQVWLTGRGHLLITDSQERQIGYIDDQFVNEIPGAFGSVPPGGRGIPAEPIYYLPLSDTYTILLDGQTLMQTETVGVTQFGPGYAVWVDDVTLEPTSQDRLTIASNGTQLAYQSSGDKEATLALALDGINESNQLQVKGANVGAGEVVTVTADVTNGQLVFNNTQATGGAYDLDVKRVSAGGEQWFVHSSLVISTTDTHYTEYGAWDGSGPMTVCVDHGSDGLIDETLVVENQVRRIHLPLIMRNR